MKSSKNDLQSNRPHWFIGNLPRMREEFLYNERHRSNPIITFVHV